MKVIQIMDNFIVAGGVNSFVYDLCSALKEQGRFFAYKTCRHRRNDVDEEISSYYYR